MRQAHDGLAPHAHPASVKLRQGSATQQQHDGKEPVQPPACFTGLLEYRAIKPHRLRLEGAHAIRPRGGHRAQRGHQRRHALGERVDIQGARD